MSKFTEKLMLVALPKILLGAIQTYFRLEVEGLENLPQRGRALIVPNHSGCTGLDAIMLSYSLQKELNRIPRILALWTFFELAPSLGKIAKKMGLKQASAKTGLELLKKNHLTVIFPEGVHGSFKSSLLRYQLQPFNSGFIRLSLLSGAPIIPTVIIGAEESNLNIGKIYSKKYLKDLALPIPLNLFPLPAKWKIRFLPQIDLAKLDCQDSNDKVKMQAAADHTREMMQNVIHLELLKRKYVYFPRSAPLFKYRSA